MNITTTRLVLVAALAALAFGAWRVMAKPAADAQATVAGGAVAAITAADTARFSVAQTNLQLQLQTTGSYVGAQMPPGLTLVLADATRYCVQLADNGPVSHLAGPGGTAATGACS